MPASPAPLWYERHARLLEQKPLLRRLHRNWYDEIVSALPRGTGAVVELGTGGGFLSSFRTGILKTDLPLRPGLDATLDAAALPFRTGTLSALVLLQVLHHLPQPRLFFAEASRTLRTGGRLILIEPWITPWSRIVYRFHREPCDPNARDWEAAVHSPLDGANEALPWIVFERDRRKFENEFPELAIRSIVPSLPLAYLLSGGFSFPAIAPGGAWPTIRRVEKTFDRMAAMFATIVLERR